MSVCCERSGLPAALHGARRVLHRSAGNLDAEAKRRGRSSSPPRGAVGSRLGRRLEQASPAPTDGVKPVMSAKKGSCELHGLRGRAGRTRPCKLLNDMQFEQNLWNVIGLLLDLPEKSALPGCDENSQCHEFTLAPTARTCPSVKAVCRIPRRACAQLGPDVGAHRPQAARLARPARPGRPRDLRPGRRSGRDRTGPVYSTRRTSPWRSVTFCRSQCSSSGIAYFRLTSARVLNCWTVMLVPRSAARRSRSAPIALL